MSKALFTDRSPRRQISLWNAVAIYFAGRRFMIAINISINDLLNYNCDRYLPTQLQGGVACNLWCHLSTFHTLLLTARANSRCVPWYGRCSHRMLFQFDLTSFVTVTSSFNFRRPDIWLIRLVFMLAISSRRLELNKSFQHRNDLLVCCSRSGACHYTNQQHDVLHIPLFYTSKMDLHICHLPSLSNKS